MDPEVLIVGQGLAGSLLGWELERAGVSFAIADPGHAMAASAVAAGVINPVAGRRLVKTWRVEDLLPLARATYREIGDTLAASVWHEVRIRRRFAEERERLACAAKFESGALAPFVRGIEGDGCWIEGAGRVDVARLLAGLRARWMRAGRLRSEAVDPLAELRRHRWVIDCRGLAGAKDVRLGLLPWEYSKGEVLKITASGLDPGIVLNRRHWVAPIGGESAWVGATHEPGKWDSTPTETGREALASSARGLLGVPIAITCHLAGVRVNLPDKLPVAGMHQQLAGLGLCNGLGAKGALWAPMLARRWRSRIQDGGEVVPEWDVGRLGPAR